MSLTNDEITTCINEIIKIKNSEFMINLKQNNLNEYNKILNSLFPLFKNRYETIFKTVCENDDLEFLYYMLKMKDKIDNGSNKEEIEKEVAIQLSEKYIKK
tara:strand:+ start:402 stop:704 length:303 start_codon:yes stop_codon:yes gene_type:complete